MMNRKKTPNAPKAEAAAKSSNKNKRLIKKLAVLLGIAVAVLGVLAGLMIFLEGVAATAEKERDTIKGEIGNIKSKTANLNNKIQSLGAASQIYADLAEERQNMEFTVDPAAIRSLMARLKEKYFITTLNIELADEKPIDMAELNNASMQATRFEVTMNIGGVSDHYVYAFIAELKKSFPGMIQINSVSLARRQPIDIDVLSKVSRGNAVETVTGTIKFSWFGFVEQVVETEEPIATEGAPQ